MNPGNTNLIFSIQMMQVKDGKALRAMEPDKDGVYKNIPLGVIGIASRNNVFYEPASVVGCMSNPSTAFYKKLIEGNLRGEYGHPLIKNQQDMLRVIHIAMDKVSHAILKIETKKTSDGNFIVIYGDVKPMGPFGEHLDKSFKDPKINTSFSLRSLCSKPVNDNGIMRKRMLSMVTFDAVDGPGYEMASKRYTPSVESQMSISDAVKSAEIRDLLGMETDSPDELFDMLATDAIHVKNIGKILCDTDKGCLITPVDKKSIFHSMFDME